MQPAQPGMIAAGKGLTFGLLGIKAVIAESFERIHRSNLVGMGIVPMEFPQGENAETLGLDGTETFYISGISEDLKPHKPLKVTAKKNNGETIEFESKARFDSAIEIEYYRHGGILHYVLRGFLKS